MGRIEFEKVSDPLRVQRGDLVVFPPNRPKLFAPARTLAHRGLSAGFTLRSSNEITLLENEITSRAPTGAIFFISATRAPRSLNSPAALSNSIADFDPKIPRQDAAFLVPLHLEEDYSANPGADKAKFIGSRRHRANAPQDPPVDDFAVKTLSAMLKFRDLRAAGFPTDSALMTPVSDLAMEGEIDCMESWTEDDRRPILCSGATPRGASVLHKTHNTRVPPAEFGGDAAVPARYVAEAMYESAETGRMASGTGSDPTDRRYSIEASAKFLENCHRLGAVTLRPKSRAFAEAVMSSTMYNSFAYLAREWEIRANYAAALRVQLAKEEKILRTRTNDWKKMKNKMKHGPELRKNAADAVKEAAK